MYVGIILLILGACWLFPLLEMLGFGPDGGGER